MFRYLKTDNVRSTRDFVINHGAIKQSTSVASCSDSITNQDCFGNANGRYSEKRSVVA